MSFRKTTAKSGKGKKKDGSDQKDMKSWNTKPPSSQKTSSVADEDFGDEFNSEDVSFYLRKLQQSNYGKLYRRSTASESEQSTWVSRDSYQKDLWSSESDLLAGPSRISDPQIEDTQIVSEVELAQLAQIRPFVFTLHEKAIIKDYLKIFAKKAHENEINQEFSSLEYKNLPGEFNSGNQPHNRDKNRYRDILPYDSTRVPLGENMDYINASYIRIVNSGEEYFYIATQGPLPGTIEDFWQMVLENNSNIIVMITKETECGVNKCHHYWPSSTKQPLELKNCRVFLEKYQILQCFIIRILQVIRKSTGQNFSIKQLQFTNWPDHGTPDSVDGFIKYVRYVRKSHLSGPMVVHCSAGVGRTGVFLCVDVVLCAIEKNFSFDIWNIVAQMRGQRRGMIQTKGSWGPQRMNCLSKRAGQGPVGLRSSSWVGRVPPLRHMSALVDSPKLK